MADVFVPLSLTISQVFIDGDPLYKIPNYQRPYSWTSDEVEPLWDDLYTAYQNNKEDPETDSNYFLGSLIIVPQEKGYEDVVDGQQRLTTLMILFNVISKLFPEINLEIDAEENPNVIKISKIKNCIENTNNISRIKLLTHPQHQNDFKFLILDNKDFSQLAKPNKKEIANSPKHRFINTAFIFYTKLIVLNNTVAGEFINYLFNQVKIIKISCSDRAFAIKLFQVLNGRGLNLSSADLLKSILLSAIKNDLDHDAFVANWQVTEQLAEKTDTNLTDLFTFYEYYLLAENPKKSLVEELETYFKGKDSNDIIYDFKKFVELYYNEIYTKDDDKIIYSFWYLTWATYWKTILLTALHSKYENIEKLKLLLRRYYYLNWIAGRTLSQVKQTSFNIIKAIKNKTKIAEIEKMLNNKLEEDKVLVLVLKNLEGDIYFEAWVKPLYLMVEYHQFDDDYVTWIEWDKKLQLEHILPQSFKNKKEWKYISEELGNSLLHTAANLTILSSKKNIEAQNYSFSEKIDIYQGLGKNNTKSDGITSFRISQKIVDDYNENKYNKMWTEKAMTERYNWFITEIGKVLEIDVSSILKTVTEKIIG